MHSITKETSNSREHLQCGSRRNREKQFDVAVAELAEEKHGVASGTLYCNRALAEGRS